LLEEVCKTTELESQEKRASGVNSSLAPSPSKQHPSTLLEPRDFVEIESLKEQRMQEACWCTLCAKNEGQYKDFCDELERKEKPLEDLEKHTVYCELQCNALGDQFLSLKRKGSGFILQPHPLVYPSEVVDRKPDFIKINPCVCCKGLFPHNDIVVSSCRHLYHPWCAAIHFKLHSKCYETSCEARMSPEWYLSFGFGEFDKDMKEQELAEGYEEAHLQLLNLRS
jgi:hypothetical protein